MRNIARINKDEMTFDVDVNNLAVSIYRKCDEFTEIYITSKRDGLIMVDPRMQIYFDIKDKLKEHSPVDRMRNVLYDIDDEIAYYNLSIEEQEAAGIDED